MRKIMPKYLLERHQLTGTVTFAVLFSIVFLNLYIPFSDTAWFRLGNSVFFLFTAGFIAISILFVTGSRVLMYRTRKMFDMTVFQYVLWCVAEVVVICLFYTFVTVDIVHPEGMPVIRTFLKALIYGSVALLVPYMMSAMYFMISEKEKTIRLMNSAPPSPSGTSSPADPESGQEDSLLTFYDSGGSLRFSVRSSCLYYVESDDNYIKVWYDDVSGNLSMYMIRCSLRTVEENFKDTFLMRCNRKYIVNMKKVRSLRKDSDGYYLDLDNSGIPPIAVTKTYTDAVLKWCSLFPAASAQPVCGLDQGLVKCNTAGRHDVEDGGDEREDGCE